MKIGYGQRMKALKDGRKANRKIGGSVIVLVGCMSSSMTGAILRMKLSKRCSLSSFSILLTSIE